MWGRLRERLFNAVGVVIAISWLFASVAIATELLGFQAQRSNLWVVSLIFLAPFAALILVGELVHRIKFGPTMPGRHSRGMLDLDVLGELDEGLMHRNDASDS